MARSLSIELFFLSFNSSVDRLDFGRGNSGCSYVALVARSGFAATSVVTSVHSKTGMPIKVTAMNGDIFLY